MDMSRYKRSEESLRLTSRTSSSNNGNSEEEEEVSGSNTGRGGFDNKAFDDDGVVLDGQPNRPGSIVNLARNGSDHLSRSQPPTSGGPGPGAPPRRPPRSGWTSKGDAQLGSHHQEPESSLPPPPPPARATSSSSKSVKTVKKIGIFYSDLCDVIKGMRSTLQPNSAGDTSAQTGINRIISRNAHSSDENRCSTGPRGPPGSTTTITTTSSSSTSSSSGGAATRGATTTSSPLSGGPPPIPPPPGGPTGPAGGANNRCNMFTSNVSQRPLPPVPTSVPLTVPTIIPAVSDSPSRLSPLGVDLPDILNSHLPPPPAYSTLPPPPVPHSIRSPPPPVPPAPPVPPGRPPLPSRRILGQMLSGPGTVLSAGPPAGATLSRQPSVTPHLTNGYLHPIPPPPHTQAHHHYHHHHSHHHYLRSGCSRDSDAETSTSKTCLTCTGISIRWFILLIAFIGLLCATIGTVIGAAKAHGREHLTLALLMIGVGLILLTVSCIAWRLTATGPSWRTIFGLTDLQSAGVLNGNSLESNSRRFLPRVPVPHGRNGAHHHPYGAMFYPEFQYRPPPPSYQASMQEYRLRLLLLERSSSSHHQSNSLSPVSPPPTYRSSAASSLAGTLSRPSHCNTIQRPASRPPSYRSVVDSTQVTTHPGAPLYSSGAVTTSPPFGSIASQTALTVTGLTASAATSQNQTGPSSTGPVISNGVVSCSYKDDINRVTIHQTTTTSQVCTPNGVNIVAISPGPGPPPPQPPPPPGSVLVPVVSSSLVSSANLTAPPPPPPSAPPPPSSTTTTTTTSAGAATVTAVSGLGVNGCSLNGTNNGSEVQILAHV